MHGKYTRQILICLLMLACSFTVSCSTEPTVQANEIVVQQGPKPLEDVVVANEDEVLTWDESAGKTEPPHKETD